MKTPYLILCVASLTAFIANGQGTFIYDQQSATNQGGGLGAPIQSQQPMGQSFTPTLSSVGFVKLEFYDKNPGNGLGATVYVNLWSGSISNTTLLGSTGPIFMPDGFSFGSITNFSFSTSISVTPGSTYYLQPFVQSGDNSWDVVGSSMFNYLGGTAIFNGSPDSSSDLWFREGVIDVPEPSSATMILLGSGLFHYARHKYKKHSRT
jgi:hypothetical protein